MAAGPHDIHLPRIDGVCNLLRGIAWTSYFSYVTSGGFLEFMILYGFGVVSARIKIPQPIHLGLPQSPSDVHPVDRCHFKGKTRHVSGHYTPNHISVGIIIKLPCDLVDADDGIPSSILGSQYQAQITGLNNFKLRQYLFQMIIKPGDRALVLGFELFDDISPAFVFQSRPSHGNHIVRSETISTYE